MSLYRFGNFTCKYKHITRLRARPSIFYLTKPYVLQIERYSPHTETWQVRVGSFYVPFTDNITTTEDKICFEELRRLDEQVKKILEHNPEVIVNDEIRR